MNDLPQVKYPYKGDVRWAFLKWADIESAQRKGYVYLRRLRIIQTPLFAVYLHFIFEVDNDQDPHDHPINFVSIVLHGGYSEQVYYDQSNLNKHFFQTHSVFSVHKMPKKWAHQIIKIRKKTVTLLLIGRRSRQWGFWTKDGWIDQNTYRMEHR
jgi:hypothetical protein